MRSNYVSSYFYELVYLVSLLVEDYYDFEKNYLSFDFTKDYKKQICKIKNRNKLLEHFSVRDFFCYLYVNAYIKEIYLEETNIQRLDVIEKYLNDYLSIYYKSTDTTKDLIILNKTGV